MTFVASFFFPFSPSDCQNIGGDQKGNVWPSPYSHLQQTCPPFLEMWFMVTLYWIPFIPKNSSAFVNGSEGKQCSHWWLGHWKCRNRWTTTVSFKQSTSFYYTTPPFPLSCCQVLSWCWSQTYLAYHVGNLGNYRRFFYFCSITQQELQLQYIDGCQNLSNLLQGVNLLN